MTTYVCPNCSKALSEGAASRSCPACGANFGAGSAWTPVDVGKLAAGELPPSFRVLKACSAAAFALLGASYLYRGYLKAVMFGIGPTFAFGVLFVFLAAVIFAARTPRGIWLSLGTAFLALTVVLKVWPG